MANVLFPSYKQTCLGGGTRIDLLADTIKVVLIDTADYMYDSTDTVLSDVPAAARVGTPQALSNKSITGGIFDADDVTIPSVTGDGTEAVLLYKEGGTEATSPLIGWFEGAVTPDGRDILVKWGDVAGVKIFAL